MTRATRPPLPAAFWVLWIGILVLWTGRFVVPFMSTYLTSGAGLSTQQATTVVGMYGAGGVVASLVGGPLADRLGRLPLVLTSFVGGSVLLLLIPMVDHAPAIATVLLGYGVLGHLGGPALAAMIADRVAPASRQRAFVLQVWAMNLGFAISPILAVRLERISFTAVFVVEAAVCSAVAVYLGVMLRRTGRFGAAPWRATHGEGEGPRLGEAYRVVLRDRMFLGFVALMLAYTVVYFQSTSTLPLVMAGEGLSLDAYALLLTVNGALLCVLQLPAMRLIEKVTPSVALGTGVGLTAVGYAIQALAHTPVQYGAAVVTWTLGELATFPVAAAMVASLAPARLRGTYQGVYNLTWSASHALAPVLGGIVLAHRGAATLWWTAVAVLVVAAIAVVTSGPARERAARGRVGQELALVGASAEVPSRPRRPRR